MESCFEKTHRSEVYSCDCCYRENICDNCSETLSKWAEFNGQQFCSDCTIDCQPGAYCEIRAVYECHFCHEIFNDEVYGDFHDIAGIEWFICGQCYKAESLE